MKLVTVARVFRNGEVPTHDRQDLLTKRSCIETKFEEETPQGLWGAYSLTPMFRWPPPFQLAYPNVGLGCNGVPRKQTDHFRSSIVHCCEPGWGRFRLDAHAHAHTHTHTLRSGPPAQLLPVPLGACSSPSSYRSRTVQSSHLSPSGYSPPEVKVAMVTQTCWHSGAPVYVWLPRVSSSLVPGWLAPHYPQWSQAGWLHTILNDPRLVPCPIILP